MICGSGGLKSRLAKAAGAEPLMERHTQQKEESEGLPVLAMDYFFFFSKDEQGLPHLQVRDSHTNMCWSSAVPAKGADPFAVNFVLNILDEVGYRKLVMKSDNERSIKSLKSAVKAASKMDMCLRSPRRETVKPMGWQRFPSVRPRVNAAPWRARFRKSWVWKSQMHIQSSLGLLGTPTSWCPASASMAMMGRQGMSAWKAENGEGQSWCSGSESGSAPSKATPRVLEDWKTSWCPGDT